MDVPKRTGTLLVYAGAIGLATTFLLCVFLHDVLHALRGWHCTGRTCTVPANWSIEQTRDVFLLSFGVLRSVFQIRAGLHMQVAGFDRRLPLVMYLVVAALDCAFLAALGEVPTWALALSAGWPIAVYALTRSSTVRPLVWDAMRLPSARLL
jgi:hypothetical protein